LTGSTSIFKKKIGYPRTKAIGWQIAFASAGNLHRVVRFTA